MSKGIAVPWRPRKRDSAVVMWWDTVRASRASSFRIGVDGIGWVVVGGLGLDREGSFGAVDDGRGIDVVSVKRVR